MKICYLNLAVNNSRDQVTIRGLKESGVEIFEIADNSPGFKKFSAIKKKLAAAPTHDLVVVGYTGAIFVPWIRLISKKKLVYNALAPLSDGMVSSRGVSWFGKIKYWFIDFLAFHSAHLVLVESEAQKKHVAKKWFVSTSKIHVHLTGVDDQKFYFDPSVQKLNQFTVLFRGKFLPEAGVDVLLKAAKQLAGENIHFRILGHGLLQKNIVAQLNELGLEKVELITDYLEMDVLRTKMLECHLALGQLADHERLQRTIPHKAFESLSMRLPYLTGRQPAVLELLTEDETCFCFTSGNEQELAEKIKELKNQSLELEKVAEAGYQLYQTKLTPKVLAEKLL